MKTFDDHTLAFLSLVWIALVGLIVWLVHPEDFDRWFPISVILSGGALIAGDSLLARRRKRKLIHSLKRKNSE
jgi:hypothetical protein